MAKRSIHTKIEELLVSGSPFEYAHLIKFERPFPPKDGTFRSNTNRYVYLTDASRDITFHGNTYIANRVQTVGGYAETIEAKATNMSLTFSGEPLGLSYTVSGNLSSGSFAGSGTAEGEVVDFVSAGFIEGDKVKVSIASGANFSDGDSTKKFVIAGFTNDNKTITLERTGTDSDDSAFVTLSNTELKFELDSEEINSATIEKGGALPSFVNREVFIYKVFFDPDDLTTPVGASSPSSEYDNSVLVFKGIISSTNIQETPSSSRVQWNLTSHWGDFEQIAGRVTTDEIHRGLNSSGLPNPDVTLRPLHATDLGFLHAETSLSTVATYQTTETQYKYKAKRKFLSKKVKIKEEPYQVTNNHDVDLNVFLSGKYLPVVYGVQRLQGIPVFADTLNNDSKTVYTASAISEGEIHGIYNVFIDGSPIMCVDDSDAGARGVNATNSQDSALQCYGRADRGETVGGQASSGSTVYVDDDDDYSNYDADDNRDFGDNEPVPAAWKSSYYDADHVSNIATYINVSEPSANSNTLSSNVANAEGLQHKETFSINHPFDLNFTFYQGRHDQLADNTLVKQAQSTNFKRQADYYSGKEKYWGPNHRLLDTAYVVTKFVIDADATTIPEVEYVVKGKVLENYNYDGTYVHDGSLGASDNHANFKEGDTVTIQYSTDDPQDASRSWTDLAGDFRILDKYNFTTSRGTSHYRFRLDGIPDLAHDSNGAPTRKYLRLKSGTNYWHMLTWNADLIPATTYPYTTNRITPTSMSTDSIGRLQAVLSNTEEARLQAFFGTTNLSSNSTTPILLNFSGSGFTGIFKNLPRGSLRATYDTSNNTLTFFSTRFTPSQTLSGNLYIQPATKHYFSFSNLTEAEADYYAVGSMLEIIETGEKREITDWTSGYATISSPFYTTPTDQHTFKIVGKGRDLRASSNPAIQTADLLTNRFYGKDLDILEDIDLDSVKIAARLCDSRSEVTLQTSSNVTVKQNDLYKLVDGSGNHVASGRVKSDVTLGNSITFEDVSGKFMRSYQNYLNYNVGDIVYNTAADKSTRYYRVTVGGYKSTAPTHLSGTTNGFAYLSSVSLTKVSGNANSPSSLTLSATIPGYSLYDSDFVKYWRYLGWEENRQWCVTRHQTNATIDTSQSVFQNINTLLSHFNGILSYINGKYNLGVETAVTAPISTNTFNSVTYDWNVNPLIIDNSDIIGTINLNDNSQKNAKNTVKGSIFDPQNNFGSRSVTFYNSDFLKADRNVIKTGNMQLPGITNYYNARMTIEKYLMETRFNKEISFTLGPKGLLLKAGEVISLSYGPFGFENKLFRIQNLNYLSNCTVSVKAVEYDDSMYVLSPQRAVSAAQATLAQRDGIQIPNSPSSLAASNVKPGVVQLTWTNATNFKEGSDYTEIWKAGTQGSSGDITSHATLIGTVDNTTEFNDAVAVAGTFYYWIRHVRNSVRKDSGATQRLNGNFSTAINAGVQGRAKEASPQLDVDVSSAIIKFNDSGALTPSGSNQDVTLTATLRNITPDSNGVTFAVVNADQSSQTTQKVYPVGNEAGAAASISDTSSPYKVVLDASTFTSTTSNKFVKVTVTSSVSGDTFTELIPITVTNDGSSGSIGKDAAAVSLVADVNTIVYSANDPDSENPSNQSVTLTATGLGTSGSNSPFTSTPTYTFSIDGGSETAASSTTGTSSATFNLPDSDEPAANATKTVTVFLRDGSGGDLKASDSVTIFGIKSGSDSTTTFLTNDSHVVSAASDGTVSSFADADGNFKVLIGSTDETANCSFAVQSSTGVTTTINTADNTPVNGEVKGFYRATAMSANTGTAVYRVTIPASVSPTGTQFTIDRTFTISKSREGSAGSDAAGLTVSSNIQTFSFDNSLDTTPTPTTATITVNQQNQASNLVTGDIAVTNGTKSNFSYSGSNGTGTATVTVTPTGTYPITVTVTNDGLSDNLQIAKVTGGDDGNNDPRSAVTFIFNNSTGSTITAPTDTTSGTPYNFETGVLTIGSGGSSGWSTSRPVNLPYWVAQVNIKETTAYEGSQTVDYQTPRRVGKIGIRDEGDFRIQMKSDLSKFEYSFDAGSNFDDGATIPTGVKNTSIDIDSSTGQISGIGTGNNSRVFNDVIGISLDTTTNVGRLTISGVGTSNTTADITKSNLALDYDDGATVGARLGTNLKTADGLTTLGDNDVKNASITLESDGSLANIGTTQVLSNSKISINSSNGQISGIGTGNNSRVFNDVIGISLDTTTNVGRLTISGVGASNTTADITKTNLGLQYDDGATVGATLGSTGNLLREDGSTKATDADVITSQGTANNVSNVGNQTVANAQTAVIAANAGLTSAGIVNQLVPKEKGGFAEDISSKSGVVDFSSGSANFRATLPKTRGGFGTDVSSADGVVDFSSGTPNFRTALPRTRGGFGIDIANLLGTGTGKLPRWTGSAWSADNETDFKNDQIIDGNGNIKDTIGLALPSGGGTFSPTEFKNLRESFDNIGNSGTIQLQAGKVPIDDANFFKVDSGEIKFGDSISYTGHIIVGPSGAEKVGLVGSGTGGSTVRIFAGQTFTNRSSAPFRVSEAGEVNVTSINVNTTASGSTEKTVRIKPDDITNVFFAVGAEDPTDAPLQVKSNNGTSEVIIDNLKLYKSDGSTLYFDSATGFTDAALNQIASGVGSSATGASTVNTVDVDTLINPFTTVGGNSIQTTIPSGKKLSQKITIGGTGTSLTVKAKKSADFLQTSTTNNVLNKIPTAVKMRVGYSTSSNLSNPTWIAEIGNVTETNGNTPSTIGSGVTRVTATDGTGTPNAYQYEILATNQSEEGFELYMAALVDNEGSDAVTYEGVNNETRYFEISDTRNYANTAGAGNTTDYYFFIEVGGSISDTSLTSGASDISNDCARELVITAGSGENFQVNSDGGISPSPSTQPQAEAIFGGVGITATGTDTPGVGQYGEGGDVTLDLNFAELTDMTSDISGSTEFILQNGTTESRKAASEIKLSFFNNNSGFLNDTGVDNHLNTGTANTNEVLSWNGSDYDWVAQSGGGGLPSGMTYSSSILDVTGTIRASADIIAYYSSDYRLKNNIKQIDNALDKVSQIRGVEFDWNEKQSVYEGHDIGVVAQEVEKVAPEIVITRDDGYKAVNYQKLTALLIEAVKELKEEIKELKKDK